MHLAYHMYMFVLASLVGLSQGADHCWTPPNQSDTHSAGLTRARLTREETCNTNSAKLSFVKLGDRKEADEETDEAHLMQRTRDKRKRSPSPRRRRQTPRPGESGSREDRGRGRQDSCDEEEWEWDEEARRYFRRQWRSNERTSTSSWARLPPWASRRSEPATSSGQRPGPQTRPAKAPPTTPPSTPASRSLTRTKHVSLVPTLEQLGPGVRKWSDAIGITRESENFTGQDRHLLSNSTVFGLSRDLARMTHAQRVNAYCDLIRFLGVLYADLMRTMLRAEELADEEVLLQVTTAGAFPSMAPHLHRRQATTASVMATSTCLGSDPRHAAQGDESTRTTQKVVEDDYIEACEVTTDDHPDEYVEVDVETEGLEDNLGDEGSCHQGCNTDIRHDEGSEGFAGNETEGQGCGIQGHDEDDQEDHKDSDLDIAVDEEDIVEGWELNYVQEPPEQESEQDVDEISGMQVAAKVRPTTVFASYLARLQAHFESMTAEQRANIIHLLYGMLETWRGEWVMSLTSVSRDRADRLWALLVTYQGEPACVTPKDREWAEERWNELLTMLQIDAVKGANIEDFRHSGPPGAIQVEDTQAERSSSSNEVLVQRAPGGRWEEATDKEKAELAAHDAETKEEEAQQATHDADLWAATMETAQAAKARAWDEWAVRTEMDRTSELRPLKRFRVQVAVRDADQNEVAVADLHGEIEARDAPQVTFVVTEEIVHVPQDSTDATHGEEERQGPSQGEGGNGGGESDQTEMVAPGLVDGDGDDQVEADLADLGSIMESVMGRQWFQLFVNREVDEVMVRRRWGAKVLEVFQINRDMMELQQREGHLQDDEQACGSLRVKPMSESEDSMASSGAKEFPCREVVAGRRSEGSVEREEEIHACAVDSEKAAAEMVKLDERPTEVAEEEGVRPADLEGDQAEATMGGGGEDSVVESSQQVLENTQLDVMDTVGAAEGEGEGSSLPGPTSASEGMPSESFGEGKVQTNLQSWLK